MESNELTALVNGVVEAVQSAFFDLDRWTESEICSSRRSTARVFPEFRRLAERLRFDVRFTAAEPRNYEFIYGICFLKTSGGFNERNEYFCAETPLSRSILVMECELSPREEEIVYDFSNLLLASVDLRCLILYRNSRSLVDSCVDRAKVAIATYEQSEERDRYLLCGLHQRQTTFTLLEGAGSEVKTTELDRPAQDFATDASQR